MSQVIYSSNSSKIQTYRRVTTLSAIAIALILFVGIILTIISNFLKPKTEQTTTPQPTPPPTTQAPNTTNQGFGNLLPNESPLTKPNVTKDQNQRKLYQNTTHNLNFTIQVTDQVTINQLPDTQGVGDEINVISDNSTILTIQVFTNLSTQEITKRLNTNTTPLTVGPNSYQKFFQPQTSIADPIVHKLLRAHNNKLYQIDLRSQPLITYPQEKILESLRFQ